MKHTRHILRFLLEQRLCYSANVLEGICFRHTEPTEGITPVFGCESCGSAFCPLCATGVWHELATSSHRYVWYHCPKCPIGLAYIAIPLEPTPPEKAKGAELWDVRAQLDPALQQTRPGACRVRFPALERCGFYHAVEEEPGQCFLRFGREWLSWVQRPDSVQLARAGACPPPGAHDTVIPLVVGEYMVVQPPNGSCREVPPLALFLELPQGFQEYEMRDGWPVDAAPTSLQLTDRIWTAAELMTVLPILSGLKNGVALIERKDGMLTVVPESRHAA